MSGPGVRWALVHIAAGDDLPCFDCLKIHVPRKLPNSGDLAPQWTAEDGHSYSEMTPAVFARLVLDGVLTYENIAAEADPLLGQIVPDPTSATGGD